MATVIVNCATRKQPFQVGAPKPPFTFRLTDPANLVLVTFDTHRSSVSFPQVPAGDFVAAVSRNGVTASTPFMVLDGDPDSIDVPDVITVTID